jgi:hypothetical protein
MYTVDKILTVGQQVFDALPMAGLAAGARGRPERPPPPEYRPPLDIATRYVPSRKATAACRRGHSEHGPETVSLLALRLVVEDDSTERFATLSMTAATPLAFGDEPGPLQPGSTRQVIRRLTHVAGEPKVKVEVSEVRVWNGAGGAGSEVAAGLRDD